MSTTARRGHGEGGLYFDSDTKCWRGVVDLGKGVDGKRRRVKVQARTKAEARAKLTDLRNSLSAGLPTGEVRTTVEQLLDEWLSQGLPGRSANTVENYRWASDSHLTPALGHIRLRDLTPDHVADMLRLRAEADMSRSSLNRLRSVLQQALRYAERRGKVARNVASLVDTPDGKRSEGRALTVEQSQKLLATVRGRPVESLVVTALMTGLRPGELLGLRWSDLDLEAGTLHVRGSLKREKAGLRLGNTKTRRSMRALNLPSPVLTALKAHRKAQAKQRLRAGEHWDESFDLVFCTSIGTPMDPSNLRRAFSKATRDAGLGHWHPHELRHSAASLLSAAGVPIEVVADILGHDSSRVTSAVYRHAVLPTVAAAVAPMEKMFGTASGAN